MNKSTSTILVCDGAEGVEDTLKFISATYGSTVASGAKVWNYGDGIVAVSFVKARA